MSIRCLSSFLLVPLAASCAGPHGYLDPELFRHYDSVLYLTILEQDGVCSRSVQGSTRETVMLGPHGTVKFAPASSTAHREPVPELGNEIIGVDFRADLDHGLRQAAEASPWLVPRELRFQREPLRGGQTGAEAGPVLVLRPAYWLDAQATGLVVVTDAELYLTSTVRPDYHGAFIYHSLAALDLLREGALAAEQSAGWLIGHGPDNTAERIEAWAANGGEKMRLALQEGMQATIEMLRLDLLDAPARPDPDEGGEVEAYSPLDLVRGKVLARSGRRAIVRDRDGDLWSMPAALPSAGPPLAELFTTCSRPYDLTQDCSWFSGAARAIDIDGVPLRIAGTEAGDVVLIVSGRPMLALHGVLAVFEQAGVGVERLRAMGDRGVFLELDSDGYSLLKNRSSS